MKKIVMASNNKGKIKEAQEILKEYEIVPISSLNIDVDVEEDKPTFVENAIKKATEISNMCDGIMCMADDSGIEIEYLDGFPGVQTKRWFNGTDRERNLAIIEKLNNVEGENRKVKFTTAIAIAYNGEVITSVYTMNGYIADQPKGNNGFGFDEIFELEDGRTLAQLSDDEKNEISSRKKALEQIKIELEKNNI